MPVKKTTTAKTTSSKAAITSKAKVAPLKETALAAEPKKPRATTVVRRKKADAPVKVAKMTEEQIREEICRVAYGYWVERSYAPGDPMVDWLRAEAEVRSR